MQDILSKGTNEPSPSAEAIPEYSAPTQDPGEEEVTGESEQRERWQNQPNGPSVDFAALIDAITAEGRANRGEERSEDRAKRFREWITIVLLFATVIFLAWQVHEMTKVYEPISQQANAAKTAADATVKQAANSDKTFAEAQRAWIGPDSAKFDVVPSLGKPLIASVIYHNTGREPALNFGYDSKPLVVDTADDANGKLMARSNDYMKGCFATPDRPNSGVVYPSTGFGGATLSTGFTAEEIDQAVIDGKKILLVQGCFTYRTFGQVRHSAFCFFYRTDLSKGTDMNICVNGNNAN